MVMTPLGGLIEEVQNAFFDEHGVELSYGDIARRSGTRLTRQRVQQLAKGPIRKMPDPETLTGLALGLGVTEIEVTVAALDSAGYQSPDIPLAARKGKPRPTEPHAE